MKKIAASLAALAMVFGLAGAAGTGLVNFDNAIVASAAAAGDGFQYNESSHVIRNNWLYFQINSDGYLNFYKLENNQEYRLLCPGYSYQTLALDGRYTRRAPLKTL